MAKTITKEPLKFPLNDAQLELLRAFSIKLRVSEQKELVEKGNWVKLQKAK